jgi:MHS family alpha-ketoglutarate permease-like MFS transporter
LTARERWLAIFGGSAGNLVEWFDWYAYSAFSLYFAHAFFPSANRTTQLLNTAGVFAVGFLVRPVGGWLLGRYADRSGRKAALMVSIALMCGGSLLIAVTPTYASIGAAAPAILLFARVIQGVSLGGEYGTSAAYLSEAAPPGRRGLYASFQYVAVIMGQLLAAIVLLVLQSGLLTPAQLESWGWRIPFGIGGLCAVITLQLRRSLAETYRPRPGAAPTSSGLRVLLRHRREALLVAGLTVGGTIAFYTYTTYLPTFLVNTVGLTHLQSTLISGASLLVYMVSQPILGALSDRVGRRPLLLTFGVLGMLGTVPLLTALQSARTAAVAFALIMTALPAVAAYTAVSPVVKAELFPASIRVLGVNLPYAITVSLFGGSASYVALWCKNLGRESLFYWYVSACIACSLIVYTRMRETRRTSLFE